ncbi:type II secretion system protein N [Salinispirillum marinum]|uniref:Type II secretion system protein N n=2 Tax=Saccharospirillaceae TaxID=255527 RepID=A0ABV8BIH4_9GAMM
MITLPPLAQRWLQRLFGFLLLCLAAWAGATTAKTVWQVLAPSTVVFADVDWSMPEQTPANVTTDTARQVQEVISGQWFGEFQEIEEKKPEPLPVAVETAPATRLQLVLQGVFSASDPKRGSALISQRGRGAELFQVGETLFGQAELVEVYRNRVVLLRSGTLETLSFEETPLLGSAPGNAELASIPEPTVEAPPVSVSAPQPNNVANTRTNTNTARAPEPTRNSVDVQERLNQQIRQAITDVQTQAYRNPQGLLNQYGLQLTDEGYRVTPRSGILIANGLRPGDMIVEVNGQRVGNIERDQALIESVLASGEIRITLERNGATYRVFQELPN